VDRSGACIIAAGRDQYRPALAHVTHDVVEIDQRQHALLGVAVEDDELEFLDLLLKELARRKRNQGKLIDRRAVLLFRRAKNSEVDKIDIRIRLQKIAPGALARMRLAGDEEDAQFFPHAVDGNRDAVVERRK